MTSTNILCCPACSGELQDEGSKQVCSNCGTAYALEEGVPNFVIDNGGIDESEIKEIRELIGTMREMRGENLSVIDRTSLPNRKHTKARYLSELKGLEDLIRKHGDAFKDARVLEFSCGAGRGARIAASLGAREVWMADIVSPPVRYCLDVLKDAFPDTSFQGVVAASDTVPFRDDTFDVLFIYSSAHHYPNLLEFLAKGTQISRNVFIIAEPADLGMWQKILEFFNFSTEYGDATTDRIDEASITDAFKGSNIQVKIRRCNQYFPKWFDPLGNFYPFYRAWFVLLSALDHILPKRWQHSMNIYLTRSK